MRDEQAVGGITRDRNYAAAMWNREGLSSAVVPFLGHPLRDREIAILAVKEQAIGD